MRVAILTDGVWPAVVGGIQKHTYFLSRYLVKNSVEVDLYFSLRRQVPATDWKKVFNTSQQSAIRFCEIAYPPNLRFPGHYLFESYLFSRSIADQVLPRIDEYDIVYAQGFAGWYLIQQKKKKKFATPIIVNFHGLNMFQEPFNKRAKVEQMLFRPAAKAIMKGADYIQSLGGNLTRLLLEQQIAREKIFELGIGVEHNWLRPESEIPVHPVRSFVFVGRYDRGKGIEELMRVLPKIKEPFNFHFVGPIPPEKQLKMANVIYHGKLTTEEDIIRVIDKADFLVLPSHSEGMPTVILEAMARSCAIISTDVGAVSELVSEDNGMLIEPSDDEQLLKAIRNAINCNSDHLLKMKRSSYEKIKSRFLWDQVITQTLMIFNQIKDKKITVS